MFSKKKKTVYNDYDIDHRSSILYLFSDERSMDPLTSKNLFISTYTSVSHVIILSACNTNYIRFDVLGY